MMNGTQREQKRGKGFFSLILHSHLPYVIGERDWPHGRGWLYEAATECYLPLLNAFYDLLQAGTSPQVTLSLTPVLCEQLSHPSFASGLLEYIKENVLVARQNAADFRKSGEASQAALAERWEKFYTWMGESFETRFQRSLIPAFKALQAEGHIEIITSAATHGYLPLLGFDECIQAQVKLGVQNYRKHFGRSPRGIWLPECAYRPGYRWSFPVEGRKRKPKLRKGVEEFLGAEDIKYFIIDSHLLRGGKPIGVYLSRFKALEKAWERFASGYKGEEEKERSPHSLYYLRSQGAGKEVAVFTRDSQTSLQVWSGKWGYPGHGLYLDFHKKHHPGGLRYWRVTDYKAELADKEEYRPEMVREVLEEQSSHFLNLAKSILLDYHQKTGEAGVLTAPFDTELFGHWWFEGVQWLLLLLQKMARDSDIAPSTCSNFLKDNPQGDFVLLPEGSWGEGGFHYIWLNDQNAWAWEKIYAAEEAFLRLLRKKRLPQEKLAERVLKQAARELLLLESSDWQFLISTWSARDYAEGRIGFHFDNFQRLCLILEEIEETGNLGKGSGEFLLSCEKKGGIFPELSLDLWRLA